MTKIRGWIKTNVSGSAYRSKADPEVFLYRASGEWRIKRLGDPTVLASGPTRADAIAKHEKEETK